MSLESIASSSSSNGDATDPVTAHSTWDVLPALNVHAAVHTVSSCNSNVGITTAVSFDDVTLSQRWVDYAHQCNNQLPSNVPLQLWERPLHNPFYERQPQYRLTFPLLPTVSDDRDIADVVAPLPCDLEVPDRAWTSVSARVSKLLDKRDDEGERNYAIRKWRTIIQTAPKHTAIGRTLLQCIWDLHVDDQLNSTLLDVFSTKSTKTILNRANRFSHFVIWCTSKNLAPIPVQEHIVYLYLYDNNWKGPTSADSFKQSLAFAGSVVGVDGALDACQSQRIAGFCKRKFLEKRPLKQARVLTTDQVKCLENMVIGDGAEYFDLLDRIMAGHCLYILYARSRWSDGLRPNSIVIDKLEDDSGYYQADTLISKTSTTVQKKTRFLPLTGPLKGLNDVMWIDTWMKLRAQAKLKSPDGRNPLICSVTSSGQFTDRPLSASQASKWLRDILILNGYKRDNVINVSSHSLKATLLSWLAKAGVSLQVRQILGYHVTGSSQSALRYSRDELASPLRELDRVLEMIRSGQFKPDASRSGYLAPAAKVASQPSHLPRAEVRGELAAINESDVDSESDDDSESIKSRDLSDDEKLTRALPHECRESSFKKPRTLCAKAGTSYFIHVRWRTLHVSHKDDATRLGCGRNASIMYREVAFSPSFDYPKCTDCFGKP
jgi:hypothetical protein